MGQESGLELLCDNMEVCSVDDGSNGRFGAMEAGYLTQVSLDSLWLPHAEPYRWDGGSRKTKMDAAVILLIGVIVIHPEGG